MKAFKATRNMKCGTLTYEVGGEYSIDSMKICSHGFHFCLKMEDVLNYYSYNKDFVLMEIEILGKTDFQGDKGVSDHIKVLRVIPEEEYTFKIPEEEYTFKIPEEEYTFKIPVYTYDEKGNMTSETHSDGSKWVWTYDERGNKTSETYPDGRKHVYTYDEKGNKTSETYPDGSSWNITIKL